MQGALLPGPAGEHRHRAGSGRGLSGKSAGQLVVESRDEHPCRIHGFSGRDHCLPAHAQYRVVRSPGISVKWLSLVTRVSL